jgi:hypothetical protein
MTEATIKYETRGNRVEYELTLAEASIIEWIRSGANNGHDWTGTIRYVGGANIYQMADHVNRGQVKNGRN